MEHDRKPRPPRDAHGGGSAANATAAARGSTQASASVGTRRRFISRFAPVGLVVFGIAAGLGIAELGVRALGAAPPVAILSKGRFRLSANPKLGYEPVPSVLYSGESLEFYQYRGLSNALGFRGPEYSVRKPPGTFRIVVLGDSIAEGMRIDRYEDVFSGRLEAELAADASSVEVLNFAISGYNTQQEVEAFKEKALPYGPDLVILAYCLNDREGPYFHLLKPLLDDARRTGNQGIPRAGLESSLHQSALYRFVKYRVAGRPQFPLEYADYDSGDTVSSSLEELAQLADREGFQTLVAVFPRFDDLTFQTYPFWEEHAFIRDLALANHFLFLDLLPTFRACVVSTQQQIAFDYLHPTVEGHRCAADALLAFIREATRL